MRVTSERRGEMPMSGSQMLDNYLGTCLCAPPIPINRHDAPEPDHAMIVCNASDASVCQG